MSKTILITGSTDGIGFLTAEKFLQQGHTVLMHGRSRSKLSEQYKKLVSNESKGKLVCYCADLSNFGEVERMAKEIVDDHNSIDILINNAGVFKVPNSKLENGLDVRFVVNTISPYLLTKHLLPIIPASGRVINVSSAAQSPVNLEAVSGHTDLSDSEAYSQSKLGLIMWTFHLARRKIDGSPIFLAVNPASFLGSKMVKEAYGREGKDIGIGVDALVRASMGSEFLNMSGSYYDNDYEQFRQPIEDAQDPEKNKMLVRKIEELILKETK